MGITPNKEYLEKKIYDEVSEDIFDMSNLRIFNKEIEKKKIADVYTELCIQSAEFSKEPSMLFQKI